MVIVINWWLGPSWDAGQDNGESGEGQEETLKGQCWANIGRCWAMVGRHSCGKLTGGVVPDP